MRLVALKEENLLIAKFKINALLVFVLSILIVSTFIVIAKPTETSDYKSMYTLDDGNITDHVWSSDGKEIAYIKCPNGQLWGCELWVADWNLENNQLIYTGIDWDDLYDWEREWILLGINPTSTYQLDQDGKAIFRDLWKIKDDGTELTRLTSTYTNGIRKVFWPGLYDNQGTAAWAKFIPGTDLIYFSAHDGNGWWGPHTTTKDGSDVWKRLPGFSFTITMCPAGNKLIWGSSWSGGWLGPTDLYSSNPDGSEVFKIKRYNEKKYPLCLADGNTIVMHTRDGHTMSAIDIDGTNERTINYDLYQNYMSDYHPINGQEFIMISNRNVDGNRHVYTMNSEGTGIVQLTEGPFNDYAALYSPDGGMLVYRRLPDDFDTSPGQPYPYQLVVIDLTINKIENLIADITELVDLNILNKGQGNSLIVKLHAAIMLYQKDHLHPVTNILNAFINQVYAFIKGNKLSDTQGQILIDKTLSLIEMINT